MSKIFKVLAQTEKDFELLVYGEIGWESNPTELIAAVMASKAKNITLRINSFGGDMFGGIAIYNHLKSIQRDGRTVKTVVEGVAASAASIIFLAGGKGLREMATGSALMIHNPWQIVAGDADYMEKAAGDLRVFNGLLADIYEESSNLDRETITTLMNEETWMTPEEALRDGFATTVSTTQAVAACADIGKAKFTLPPNIKVDNRDNSDATKKPDNSKQDITMLKELHAKFSDKPEQLTQACALAAADDNKLTFDEIVAKVEVAATAKQITDLSAEVTSLKQQITDLTTERDQLKAKVAETPANGAPPVPEAKGGEGDEGGDDAPANVLEQYKAIPPENRDERLKFYAANKAEILKLEKLSRK